MEEKNELDALREKLLYKQKQGYDIIDVDERIKLEEYATAYKAYLNAARTEREAVTEAIAQAEALGFVPYERGMVLEPGTKIYKSVRGKALMLAVMGRETLDHGANIAAAHVDSPRLDLKPIPLYEKDEICLLKTHYYGGIKKYQWTTIPLAIHGVVAKKDGSVVEVVVGEDDNDPVFYITDLLPHLAGGQMAKTGGNIIAGEQLNILIGSRPYSVKTGDAVKLNIMKILNDKYGITEGDFMSAELEMVPANKARDIGFDRSLIGAYGHDDRVCAYPTLTALMETENPKHTVMAILADKEEIGSEGNSGMKSAVYFDIIADMANTLGVSDAVVRRSSKCLSSDVNAAYDPNFAEVHERRNSCFANGGVVITKFTGSRGKSGSNDASAEFMGFVRSVLDDAGVVWQTSELGKVDAGGGGTVAMYIAQKNVDVVDLGVPVLSMHAPYEVVAKTDVYMTHKAIAAFFAK